jgi:hypothetical protein
MSAEGSPALQESETPQDSFDEDPLGASSSNEIQSAAQKVYLESNNSKKLLFLMCVGRQIKAAPYLILIKTHGTLLRREISSLQDPNMLRRCVDMAFS